MTVRTGRGAPTPLRELGQAESLRVTVEGWVTHVRAHGKVVFVTLRDGTGVCQVVIRADREEAFQVARGLTQETSVRIEGTARLDARAPGGAEVQADAVTVVGVSEGYPITPKEHGIDFLLDHRHLWLRHVAPRATLRIRNEVEAAAERFLRSEGFLRVDAPILMGTAAENTTQLFRTDYFGEPAYLSQSGQLYAEAAAMALGKVYTFGPTFRAEASKTRRHLLEFWMLEPEMAFCDLEGSMEIQERLVTAMVTAVLENCRDDLRALERDTGPLERVSPPFPRITYDEAVELLREKGLAPEPDGDFGAPHETAISDAFDRPVFVHRYPTSLKPFYMEPDPARPERALAADLLAPEGYGEIVGGSQRISDPVLLAERMKAAHLTEDAYGWYLDLRRYGSVPHSGFGLGIERTVAWITGTNHVRETIPFPRTLNRLRP